MSVNSRRRALQAVVSENISSIWDAAIAQKGNELEILNQDKQNLNTSIRDMKTRLLDAGIAIPDLDSTSNYKKASNLPIASVADNVSMTESMIAYKEGELDALEGAWNDYNQGKSVMEDVRENYQNISGITGFDLEDEDAWKRFTVEGTITDSESEMGQLFKGLNSEQQEMLTPGTKGYSAQFAQGFKAGSVTDEEGIQKSMQLLNIQTTKQELFSNRKSMVQEDILSAKNLINQQEEEYGHALMSRVSVGGDSISAIVFAMTAGDPDGSERLKELTENIADDKGGMALIQRELNTIISSQMGAVRPYAGLYQVLEQAYGEHQDMTAQEQLWADLKESSGVDLRRVAIDGDFKNPIIPSAHLEDVKRFHENYNKNIQYRMAGIWSTDASVYQDVEAGLAFNSMSEDLLTTELEVIGDRSFDKIDKYWKEGLGLNMEQSLIDINDEEYVFSPEEMSANDQMIVAFEELKAMQLNNDDDTDPPVVPLSDLTKQYNDIETAKAERDDLISKLHAMQRAGLSGSPAYEELSRRVTFDSRGAINEAEQALVTGQTSIDAASDKKEQQDAIYDVMDATGMSYDEVIEQMRLAEESRQTQTPYRQTGQIRTQQ